MIFGNVSISDRWRSGRDGPLGSQRCGGGEDPKSANPNRTWQQLSVLAHNVIRSFQLDTLPAPKPRSRKRTYSSLLRSMRTLRFLVIARAGRVARIGGRNVLRLGKNLATQLLYRRIDHAPAT
jgi:hypothetical protein